MSAIEETPAGVRVGKDIRDGVTTPLVDGVHPSPAPPVFPHLAYGDAVHTALAEADRCPDVVEAGLRTAAGRRELFLRLVWLADHPALGQPVRPHGLTLLWQPMTGWGVQVGEDVVLLDVDELAAPALLADAVRHVTEHGIGCDWLPPFEARWEHALGLDIALVHFEEREALR